MSKMRIALITNPMKEGTSALASLLVKKFPEYCFVAEGDNMKDFDVAVVLGGDGTILRAIKNYPDTPILGINFGAVGYMASAEKEDAIEAIQRVIKGDYEIEERMMLSIVAKRNEKVISEALALNDGVIIRSERILALCESFDNKLVYTFSGDGIIVATPTGSTAYSLSAGGPVAPPSMDVIIITPVCPHSIHIKPLIASCDTKVEVELSSCEGNFGMLNVDGQNVTALEAGDKVTFTKADKKAKLISLSDRNFYDILRYKLTRA